MQSFDTNTDHTTTSDPRDRSTNLVAPSEIPQGASARVERPDSDELAVFNIDGEYYAIDNFCPHKGAPLSEGQICGHIVECSWHGWQFDVRTGECLTVKEQLKTYKVTNENGVLKIEI
jgi:nitrite reductase/ring-hydroxylating ferredoxin subunit